MRNDKMVDSMHKLNWSWVRLVGWRFDYWELQGITWEKVLLLNSLIALGCQATGDYFSIYISVKILRGWAFFFKIKSIYTHIYTETLMPKTRWLQFADDMANRVSYMKIVFLKFHWRFFILDGPIDKVSALDGKIYFSRTCDKSLCEPKMA